jgi:hypothetical protein
VQGWECLQDAMQADSQRTSCHVQQSYHGVHFATTPAAAKITWHDVLGQQLGKFMWSSCQCWQNQARRAATTTEDLVNMHMCSWASKG